MFSALQDYQEPLAKAESAERLPGIRKETTSDSEKARPEDAEPLLFLRQAYSFTFDISGASQQK